MSNKQPEALRLADAFGSGQYDNGTAIRAQMEFRRLHVANAALTQSLRDALSLIESQRDRIGYAKGSAYDKNVKRCAANLAIYGVKQ